MRKIKKVIPRAVDNFFHFISGNICRFRICKGFQRKLFGKYGYSLDFFLYFLYNGIMKNENYYAQRNITDLDKIAELLDELPYFCADYFVGIVVAKGKRGFC